MARNGSGIYSLPSGNPVIDGSTIEAAWANITLNDIGNELTLSLPRSGVAPMTGNLLMGGYKITGAASGTARDQLPTLAQVQDGVATILSSVAGTNTITATAPFAMTAYATGQEFFFLAAGAITGATTLNINSIGAKSVRKRSTTALVSGDIISGMLCHVVYDGVYFQLLNTTDTTLSRLAAATNGTNKVPYFTATDTVSMLDFIDDDSMATATAASVPSGESVKAYVDTVPAREQTWTAQQTPMGGAATATTSAGWDCDSVGQIYDLTVGTSGFTLNAPTNVNDRCAYILRVTQHATTPQLITWSAEYKFPSGIDPVLTAVAGAVDIFTFIGGSGGVMHCVGQAKAVA